MPSSVLYPCSPGALLHRCDRVGAPGRARRHAYELGPAPPSAGRHGAGRRTPPRIVGRVSCGFRGVRCEHALRGCARRRSFAPPGCTTGLPGCTSARPRAAAAPPVGSCSGDGPRSPAEPVAEVSGSEGDAGLRLDELGILRRLRAGDRPASAALCGPFSLLVPCGIRGSRKARGRRRYIP